MEQVRVFLKHSTISIDFDLFSNITPTSIAYLTVVAGGGLYLLNHGP